MIKSYRNNIKYYNNISILLFLSNIYYILLIEKVRENILEVEYPLIEGQFSEIDEHLKKAESELNWTSEGIPNFTTLYVLIYIYILYSCKYLSMFIPSSIVHMFVQVHPSLYKSIYFSMFINITNSI